MRVHIVSRARVLVALLITALALSAVASAAGPSVSVKVKLEYARAQRTACHKTKDFRLFHRRSTIEARGFVLPAPSVHSPVQIEIARCVRGSFVRVGSRYGTTKLTTGKFKVFFAAARLAPASHRRRAITYYWARAVASGSYSQKSYFAVTN